MSVEVADAYVSLIPSAQGFVDKIKEELGGPLEETGQSSGDAAGEGFAAGFIGKVSGAGKAAAAGLGVGIAAVGAVGAGLFAIGSTFDDAFDKIRVTTGATGQTLEGLKGSFDTVFGDVPASAGDVSAAISTLNQRLGLTGQPLEALSTQVLNLSRITGTDLNTNLTASADLFNNWGISAADQGGKLDELFRASQATGISVGDLASTMASGGSVLRQSGLDFEHSAAFIGTLSKAGLDAGSVMPALSKAIATASKEGIDSTKLLGSTFAYIADTTTADSAATGAAIQTFGAKAGPKLAGLIREGKLSFDDLAASISAGGDTINGAAGDTEDFAEKWDRFKNQTLLTLQPVAEKVFGAVGDAMERIGPALGPIVASVGDFLGRLVNSALPVFDELVGAVRAFFAAFSAGDGDVTSSGLPGFFEVLGNAARSVWDALQKIDLGSVFGAVQDIIGGVFDVLGAINWEGLLGPLVSIGADIINMLSQIDWAGWFGTAADIIRPVADAAVDLVGAGWQILQPLLADVFQLFADHQDQLQKVADILGGVLGTAAHALSDTMQFLADHMTAVKAVLVPLVTILGLYEAAVLAGNIATGAWAIVQGVAATATGVWTGIQEAFNLVMSLNPIGLVVLAIAGLVAGIIYAYTHFEGFRNVVQTVWDVIKSTFDWVTSHWPLILEILTGPIGIAAALIIGNWDTIKNAVSAVFDWIRDHWQLILEILTGPIGIAVGIITSHWDTIKNTFTTVKDWIGDRISDIVGFFAGLPGRIVGAISWIGDAVRDAIQRGKDAVFGRVEEIIGIVAGIPGRLAGTFSGMFDGIGEAMRAAVGAVKSAWNSIPSVTIPGFHIPGTSIGFDGVTISVPKMAQGGVVNQATLALIGERGPEAVVPLDQFGGAGRGPFRDLIINPRSEASAEQIAREVRWAQLTAGV